MVNKPDSFTASDGKILFFRSWIPSESPRLVIALIHGLGEHSGRYEHWADFFCGEHIAFVAFDLRGHGLSDGKRGSLNSLKTILSDVDLFLDKAGALFPGKPLLLYGHSLGGNLALNYYLGTGDSRLSALIITSPWLRLTVAVPGLLKAGVTVLGKLFPSYTKASGLAAPDLCHDSEIVDKYISDPLVHDRISAGLYLMASRGGEEAIEKAGMIDVPMLLMHGTGDRITSHQGSSALKANATDKVTLKLWDGLFHELHNEPEKTKVFRFINDWIDNNFTQSDTVS